MNILTVFLKILPVILLIFLGMSLRRSRFMTLDHVQVLKRIVLNISLPSMLFLAFARTTFSVNYLAIIGVVFLTCLLMLLLATLVLKALHVTNPFAPALFAGFETGMIGYALYLAIYGASEVYHLAIVDLGQVIFVFFVLVFFLKRQNGNQERFGQLMRSFVTSPVILAILLGLIFSLSGLTAAVDQITGGSSLLEVFSVLANLTVPLITISIGYELQLSMNTLKWPLLTAVLRLAILMTLATLIGQYLIVGVLHLDKAFVTALYTLFLLPPPFVIPIFMQEKRPEDRQFILNTLSVHIVLSLVAFLVLNLFI
ncbi:MAG: hypothetical protein PHC86_00220 [Eubacteriales bacterium]|nr:hypothetical protein [Eubacteriales bacterium]